MISEIAKAEKYDFAFSELYERYSRNLFLFCKHYAQSKDDLHNAYQEAWTSLFENIRAGKEIKTTIAFLITVAKRRIYYSLRKSKKKPEIVKLNENMILKIDEEFDSEASQIIYEAINKLDEKYKEALVLHRIAGLKGDELVEITGVSDECIRKRSQRALGKLKLIILELNKDNGNE